jgi:hypothetical protein
VLVGVEFSYRDHATGDLLSANGFFRRQARQPPVAPL